MSIQTVESVQVIPDKVLYQDFYETFRFSQGVKESQLFLYLALTNIYADQGYKIPDLEQPKYKERVGSLRAPDTHSELVIPNQRKEFLLQWQTFNEFLKGEKSVQEFPGVNLYDRLAHDLLGNDLSFVYDSSRVRYGHIGAILKSYYRDYVMLKTPVASNSFNVIISRMHEAAEKRAGDERATNYHGRLGELAIAWDERKQGNFTAGACTPIKSLCERSLEIIRS